jgi:hypothetical protein
MDGPPVGANCVACTVRDPLPTGDVRTMKFKSKLPRKALKAEPLLTSVTVAGTMIIAAGLSWILAVWVAV